jgi:hypothetical protein
MLTLLRDLGGSVRRLILAVTGLAVTVEEITEIGRERAGLAELPKALQYKEEKR